MNCAHCRDAESWFDERTSRKELKRYRKRGPGKTTRWLLEAIGDGDGGATLLDIGGGIGAIQHELLDRGFSGAVNVDASRAYQAVALEEAERRGQADRLRLVYGDFVELADEIEPADVVTLDRVVCCYPDMESLVGRSAERARRTWAAVFPRDHALTRFGVSVVNLFFTLKGSAFRVYVHDPDGVADVLRARGFEPSSRRTTWLWQVVVWRRMAAA